MQSPLATYLKHLDDGQLAYQVSGPDETPVFFPRVVAPGTGDTDLAWRVSRGDGTVYATTVVYYKGEAPLNVALIDMDEGFRLMSRVEDIAATEVKIGMRVKLRVLPAEESRPACPVFTPVGSEASAKVQP
jgi:uncharacterized OB-fold protein